MSRRLLRLEMPVFPDHKTIRLADGALDSPDRAIPLPAQDAMLTSTRDQIWVNSLQDQVATLLALEEWDGAPPPPSEDWEDEGKAVLHLRGSVSLGTGATGVSVGRLRLCGGVGGYVVRVYARHRRDVVRQYEQLYRRGLDALSDEFQAARRELDGVEEYLLQLWREDS